MFTTLRTPSQNFENIWLILANFWLILAISWQNELYLANFSWDMANFSDMSSIVSRILFNWNEKWLEWIIYKHKVDAIIRCNIHFLLIQMLVLKVRYDKSLWNNIHIGPFIILYPFLPFYYFSNYMDVWSNLVKLQMSFCCFLFLIAFWVVVKMN